MVTFRSGLPDDDEDEVVKLRVNSDEHDDAVNCCWVLFAADETDLIIWVLISFDTNEEIWREK